MNKRIIYSCPELLLPKIIPNAEMYETVKLSVEEMATYKPRPTDMLVYPYGKHILYESQETGVVRVEMDVQAESLTETIIQLLVEEQLPKHITPNCIEFVEKHIRSTCAMIKDIGDVQFIEGAPSHFSIETKEGQIEKPVHILTDEELSFMGDLYGYDVLKQYRVVEVTNRPTVFNQIYNQILKDYLEKFSDTEVYVRGSYSNVVTMVEASEDSRVVVLDERGRVENVYRPDVPTKAIHSGSAMLYAQLTKKPMVNSNKRVGGTLVAYNKSSDVYSILGDPTQQGAPSRYTINPRVINDRVENIQYNKYIEKKLLEDMSKLITFDHPDYIHRTLMDAYDIVDDYNMVGLVRPKTVDGVLILELDLQSKLDPSITIQRDVKITISVFRAIGNAKTFRAFKKIYNSNVLIVSDSGDYINLLPDLKQRATAISNLYGLNNTVRVSSHISASTLNEIDYVLYYNQDSGVLEIILGSDN